MSPLLETEPFPPFNNRDQHKNSHNCMSYTTFDRRYENFVINHNNTCTKAKLSSSKFLSVA